MSKEQLSRVSAFFFIMILAAVMLGSCLNPVSFDEDSLPRIKVEVSGSISINDVAVLWLINRTKTVEVQELTVSRPKGDNEAAEDYKYPKKTMDMPGPGSSLASYHVPTEVQFTLTLVYRDTKDNKTGILGPFTVQFPRAKDYRYYLYWTVDGQIVLVNEDKMQELPPDPNSNYPDLPPSSADAQTLVVINVTPDQDLDQIEFEKEAAAGSGLTYLLEDRPHAKDQARILLDTGSYTTTASYTRSGISQTIGPKTTIITKEEGSMAFKTNYLYFYKVRTGGYDLSPVWPPLSNDAADENSIIDALTDTQGILQITNGAEGSDALDIIQKILIDGTVYPSGDSPAAYMVPGDVNQYIVEAGTISVSFKPMDPHPYGGLISRTIRANQITTLVYTRALAGGLDEAPAAGKGLIRITNNSSAPVVAVTVSNRSESDPGKIQLINYDKFLPAGGIASGSVGRVVAGGEDFDLDDGLQLIQVHLETPKGPVSVERVAFLNGKIVDIVITEESLTKDDKDSDGGPQPGATVKVVNNTAATIQTVYIYDKADQTSASIYFVNVPAHAERSFKVLSNDYLSIVEGHQYAAALMYSISGKLAGGNIPIEFDNGLNDLYSLTPDTHIRTITLNKLPTNFVPVVAITTKTNPYEFSTWVKYNKTGNGGLGEVVLAQSEGSPMNQLNLLTDSSFGLKVLPTNATKQSPIVWTVVSGPSNCVKIDSGVLEVIRVAHVNDNVLTLKALIKGAGEGEIDFVEDTIQIRLVYGRTDEGDKWPDEDDPAIADVGWAFAD
jgi:hypothetical protein